MEEIKIDGIPIEDYGTLYSRSTYPKNETVVYDYKPMETKNIVISREYVEKNYVSKKKIEEKIKKIEKYLYEGVIQDFSSIRLQAKKEVLKSLLEEEE